jgi:hypothetical protein
MMSRAEDPLEDAVHLFSKMDDQFVERLHLSLVQPRIE